MVPPSAPPRLLDKAKTPQPPPGPVESPRPRQAPLDYQALAELLDAVSYAARLELLDLLRFPQTLGDIRLRPHRLRGGGPDRRAARQTVEAHLEKLLDAGLVRAEEVEKGGRQVNRYTVHPPKLYALVEELRRISTMHAARPATGGDATGTLGSSAPAPQPTGPRVTLVHGVYEGKAFALTEARAVEGKWVIGRRVDLPVSLDYDPFISLENSAVHRDAAGRFHLTDLAQSKNGTALNWAPLPKGGTVLLRSGDIVGVGRSLLCFVPE